jgi:hypothetical protein
MYARDLRRERTSLEKALKSEGKDFAATYLAVCDLKELIQTHPEVVRPETIQALQGVLKDMRFSDQTQALFLYKEAASALTSAIVRPMSQSVAEGALSALKNVLGTTGGHAHRGVAGALGSLPLAIRGPKLPEEEREDIPRVSWDEILAEHGIANREPPRLIGRSLVIPVGRSAPQVAKQCRQIEALPGRTGRPYKGNGLLVVKLACTERGPRCTCREAAWMEHLHSNGYSFPVRFSIPTAMKIRGGYLFRLDDAPKKISDRLDPHPQRYAIGFFAHEDYFVYPNGHKRQERLTVEGFKEVMFRNAWLLGRLTLLGIAHCAPIPLFHNRVQRNRRADRGLYEWPRGGRLDRWLDSCSYPNFGMTGIRDFEHLVTLNGGGQKIYHLIGTHIISLLLVAGSYFRHKDRGRVGLDGQGKPMDARDLFDKGILKELVKGIVLSYYHGFVGTELSGEIPLDFHHLSSRMIEEMGVDRHMEEVLRVADQRQMSDAEFSRFLSERGFSESKIRGFRKGFKDITVYSGPHLGGFNERISLPELIESAGTISALCVVARYWREKFSESLP